MAARVESPVTVTADDPGNDPGFDAIYQQQWWPMLRLAVGLVDDRAAAEDVVQDAFAALYRRWDCVAAGARIGYLRVSVVNAARSALRRRMTARKYLHAVVDTPAEAADHTSILSAEHEMVRRAMTGLPQRQREVLTLRYIVELPDSDIARATGLSPAGVRSASSRGLAALRTTLGGQL